MTSYSGTESKADTASLFTVPQDQMAHIQVVAVEKTKLPRLLRLTGNATYNAFKTTPVFSAIGGPVHEILVAPGETVHAGQPLLTVNSPDYSVDRSAYIKARTAFSLADKIYTRAQDLFTHGAIAESDLQQAESARTQAQADMQSSEDALRALGLKDPEAIVKNPPKMTSQVPVIAPVGGEVVERLVGPGQLLHRWRHTNLHHLGHEHRLGSRQRLSRRHGLRARRRFRGHHHRFLSRHFPRKNFLHRACARSHHAHSAGAHRHRTIPAKN